MPWTDGQSSEAEVKEVLVSSHDQEHGEMDSW